MKWEKDDIINQATEVGEYGPGVSYKTDGLKLMDKTYL